MGVVLRREWRLYRRESSEGALLWGQKYVHMGAEVRSGGGVDVQG